MKQKKEKPCDHSCFMCQHVIEDWQSQIDAQKRTIKLKRGEQFIQEGESVRGVYFVQSGVVKVHRRWGDKDVIVRFAKKGDIVGHRGLGSKQSVYPISATALEPSLMCFIDLPFFMSTLRFNPSLSYQLMLFFADELQLSEQKMCYTMQLPVKNRLAWSLLLLRGLFGEGFEDGYLGLTLSKTDIAGYIGATYETVYRMLGELAESGFLRMEGKRIYLQDIDALQLLAEEKA